MGTQRLVSMGKLLEGILGRQEEVACPEVNQLLQFLLKEAAFQLCAFIWTPHLM